MRQLLPLLILLFVGCKEAAKKDTQKLQVVTTTTMITDLVKQIGGGAITVTGLMGAGVDPHLYKASEGDVSKLIKADVIFYNGLHLEGKLVEVFEKMGKTKVKTIALAESLNPKKLISSDYFKSNYDPHIWFAIQNWQIIAEKVILELKKNDPSHANIFEKNGKQYAQALSKLSEQVTTKINTLPKEKRILITAHDAFSYFGKSYDFQVVGLQGLSTTTEAGVKDVQRIANIIIEKNVKAIFVESSVPKRTIEALQAAVASKNQQVVIGGTLYSDALGTPETPEGTYIGMYNYNVKTIVEALQ